MKAAEAVKHGTKTVNRAVFGVMFGIPFAGGAVAFILGAPEPVGVAGLLFIPCLPAAWLTWSVLAPRWRVWAYERVDDLGEMKRLAVQANLIWPDGHIFERTEWRTFEQQQRLLELERQHRETGAAF